MRLKLSLLPCAASSSGPSTSPAKCYLQVMSRQDVLDGQAFGTVGAYEKLLGEVVFAVDPDNPLNTRIVDLAHARSATGDVEARAISWCCNPNSRRRPACRLDDVSNRGGKAALMYFNGARYSLDPTLPDTLAMGC